MKKLFFILLTLLFSMQFLHAQRTRPRNLPNYDKTKLHFGFSLGVNETNFNIQKNKAFALQDSLVSIDFEPQKGFDLHIVSNLRLGEYFDLRFWPGLTFAQRNLVYTFKEANGNLQSEVKDLKSTYIDFPFDIKYKSNRINNYRFYVLSGLQYSLDLESQQNANDPTLIKLVKNDFYYNAGVGVDFYLDYFKFSVELKGSFGLTDVLYNKDLIYTKYIDKITAQKFMITLHFE